MVLGSTTVICALQMHMLILTVAVCVEEGGLG